MNSPNQASASSQTSGRDIAEIASGVLERVSDAIVGLGKESRCTSREREFGEIATQGAAIAIGRERPDAARRQPARMHFCASAARVSLAPANVGAGVVRALTGTGGDEPRTLLPRPEFSGQGRQETELRPLTNTDEFKPARR
ncbi:MAG: hypothetical protein ABIQ12_03305 [Opitutaceae bacterium]